VARARALLASMDCRVERGHGGAIIHLPALNVYEVVVIE
jgi:hypothetical protein